MKPGEGLAGMTASREDVFDIAENEHRAPSRSIGEILIDAGRLDAKGAAAIAVAQQERRMRFGDAAVELGVLKLADIEFALARQFEYPYLRPGDETVSETLVTAYRPFDPVAEQMRSLRAWLTMHQLVQQRGPRSITVLSASRKEGRSFVAANLAIVFSQMGERTLLIDADLRRPVQHQLFKIDNRFGLSNILVGRSEMDCVKPVQHFVDLSVLTAGSAAPNPQELLSSARLSNLLRQSSEAFDVVIIDTPPAADSADAQIIAARSGLSLLVTRANLTDAKTLRRVRSSLRESGANVAGSILNHG